MRMRKILTWLGDSFYYIILNKELAGMKSVLDVGCGARSPLADLRKTFYSVGIDIFEPSIEQSKKTKLHDDYILGDVLKLKTLLKQRKFDAVVALDIVEHLEKKDGWKLLAEMEKVAKKKIIILTPYGFTQQHPYESNPYQIHKSGWYPKEFEKLGYKVYGMRGLRFIRGECANIKYKPWFFWGTISVLSQFVTFFFPSLSYQLIAVKDKE
ncbi:MAG: class I SAM-dependent methyltransferase [Candidatus Levybacteria bacterium]|nr:class I SAM-dependent methyltransferase [Candidatus Levybacteria bacterium]